MKENVENKPRDWVIRNGHTERPFLDGPDIAYADEPRVIEYSAYEAIVKDHGNDWRRIQDAERALEAAIKERDEFKAAADIINAANDRLEDLLHKMTEERDSAEAAAVEAALLLAISNKKRDEARANLDKALQYDGETAERVRSAKLVEALKRWFKATESNRNNDAPAFYEIWAKECLDSLRALEEALAEYSKGES